MNYDPDLYNKEYYYLLLLKVFEINYALKGLFACDEKGLGLVMKPGW